MDVTGGVTCALRAEAHHPPLVVETPKTLKIRSGCEGGGKGALIQENKSATLGCDNDQTVFVPKVYGICSKQSHAMLSDNPHSGFYEADTLRCLDRSGGNPSCNQGGMVVVDLQDSMIGRAEKNDPQGSGVNEDVSFTLDATDRHAVAYCMTTGTYTQILKEQSPTLMARDYKDPPVVNETEPEYIVRRLTPLECERLQGYPDGWTDIGDWVDAKGRKRKTSDSIRYRSIGNSIALPFWQWLTRRISAQYDRPATLGSLFDGIGGFPYCWERCNGRGTAIWASEIDEFCIAVTERRINSQDIV